MKLLHTPRHSGRRDNAVLVHQAFKTPGVEENWFKLTVTDVKKID